MQCIPRPPPCRAPPTPPARPLHASLDPSFWCPLSPSLAILCFSTSADTPAWPPCTSNELPSLPFSPSSIAYAQSCVMPSITHPFTSQAILAATPAGFWLFFSVPSAAVHRLRWATISRPLGSDLGSLGGQEQVMDRSRGGLAAVP
jgi:hypothetical protein